MNTGGTVVIPISRPKQFYSQALDERARYARAHQYPMTDCMNPAFSYYSPPNARLAFDWHEENGCRVGVCATMTAAIIVIRRNR